MTEKGRVVAPGWLVDTNNEAAGHYRYEVSVVIPSHNEKLSLKPLVERLVRVLSAERLNIEIIVVDDGSTDGTGQLADELARANPIVRAVHSRRQRGKTAAVKAGVLCADSEIIVIIDADLQYNPEDAPTLLHPIFRDEYDLVNGRRAKRNDPMMRILASRMYNWLVRVVFQVDTRDNNSGFKAARRGLLLDVMPHFMKNFHRYLVPLARHYGYRVVEVPISHNPRTAGHSKYSSFRRLITGPLDLLALKISLVFEENPMEVFGTSGITMGVTGTVIGAYLVILRIFLGEPISQHLPLGVLAVVLALVGILLFMMGLLANALASARTEILETLRINRSQAASG